MAWLLVIVLGYVALVLLAVVLLQRADLRDKDAKIARLEGTLETAAGTMRNLVDAHCMCANDGNQP